jgi:choline kinase
MIKAIILAAGNSKRLRPLTNDKPKCLLKLNGITILDYQIKTLKKAGINQILLVVGYKKQMIINHAKDTDGILFIENNAFDTTDNAYSTLLALRHINPKTDSVIILDGDVIFDPRLLQRLANCKYTNVMIVDNRKPIEPEDCKVKIEKIFATAIGKKVNGQTVYTSMIKIGGTLLTDFISELQNPRSEAEWYSEPFNRLIQRDNSKGTRRIRVIPTGNLLRCEIDTWHDLLNSRKIYQKIIHVNTEQQREN